jgi:hypothetical protein
VRINFDKYTWQRGEGMRGYAKTFIQPTPRLIFFRRDHYRDQEVWLIPAIEVLHMPLHARLGIETRGLGCNPQLKSAYCG